MSPDLKTSVKVRISLRRKRSFFFRQKTQLYLVVPPVVNLTTRTDDQDLLCPSDPGTLK